MQRLLTTILTFFSLTLLGYSQTKVTWGDEFKMHKGSTDLAVIYSEPSGIYLEESHYALKSYFVIGATVRASGTLVKLDASMHELYRNDFDKELKGKEYDRLFFIQNHLYLFATDYNSSTHILTLFAAEIDKGTGNLKGDWQQIYTWQKMDRTEQIDFNITYNGDSSRIVLSGTYTGRSQNRYEIKMMDASLHSSGKPITLSNEFDPKTFQVQDLVYTPAGNTILVGRIYDYEEGAKKKDKNLFFQNYNIRVYDPNGKKINEIRTDIDGQYLVTGKVVQSRTELILAAFYSKDKKKTHVDGLLIQRLDPATGNILLTSKTELNNGLISEVEEEDDDKKKTKEEENPYAGLAANLLFRNFFLTPDNGLVILAERYTQQNVSGSSYNPGFGGSMNSWTNYSYTRYQSGDIYMSKVSADGNIEWIHVLPKAQEEQLQTGYSSGPAPMPAYNFFNYNVRMPYYSGFGALAGNNTVHLFFNDAPANASVLQLGQKIKKINSLGYSTCFQVDLDAATGKYTRKDIFSNKNIPTSMPRLGVVLNNTMYLVGRQERGLSKTKLAVGKIECQN